VKHKVAGVLLFLLGVTAVSGLSLPGETMAAAAVTLKVYDPTGLLEINQFHAPRLDTLEGKTICEISDLIWRDTETFPIVRSLLQNRFPTAKIIPYTELPAGKYFIDSEDTVKAVKAKGCQAIIAGNAG
jgi:hypothetical protein